MPFAPRPPKVNRTLALVALATLVVALMGVMVLSASVVFGGLDLANRLHAQWPVFEITLPALVVGFGALWCLHKLTGGVG